MPPPPLGAVVGAVHLHSNNIYLRTSGAHVRLDHDDYEGSGLGEFKVSTTDNIVPYQTRGGIGEIGILDLLLWWHSMSRDQ